MKFSLEDLKKIKKDDVQKFCMKNIRYIVAFILLIVIIVVLVKCTGNDTKKPVDKEVEGKAEDVVDPKEEDYQVNQHPEVNTLIQQYYNAYASGDITTLMTLATPVSEMEQGFINVFGSFVESYNNIACYTKSGMEEGSYVVSVYFEMKFNGVETLAPSLDFFYVRTNEAGGLYIDNLYCQYNLLNREQELNAEVEAYIAAFEQEEDVVKLRNEVQVAYDAAMVADEALNVMVSQTVPAGIQTWIASITAPTPDAVPPVEETPPVEVPPVEEAPPAAVPPVEEAPVVETPPTTEEVYANANINIRKEPNEASEKVGAAVGGDKIIRLETRADGWSKISFNNQEAYVKSEFLSTTPPTTEAESGQAYFNEGEVLTIKQTLNVRSSMSETSDKITSVYEGDKVTVILSYAEGWTKVTIGEKTGYIKTDLL